MLSGRGETLQELVNSKSKERLGRLYAVFGGGGSFTIWKLQRGVQLESLKVEMVSVLPN